MKKEKEKKKKKKEKFVDDGRVIANMDYENISGYHSKEQRKNHEAIRAAQVSRKERRAIYRAAFWNYMPVFGVFLFSIIFILLFLYFFWIN